MTRNLKNLADEYEDNDDEFFEKLTRKPKYSKKTREVEIRKQRQRKEKLRSGGYYQEKPKKKKEVEDDKYVDKYADQYPD